MKRHLPLRPVLAMTVLGLVVSASGSFAAAPSLADPSGQNGTVKIDGVPTDAGHDNDPHPGCGFTVQLFGFDAGATTGSVLFEAQSPTPGGPLSFPLGFTAPTRLNGDTFDYGNTYDISSLIATLTPQKNQGYHIKATITVVEANGTTVTKTKVYWVDTCAPPSSRPIVFVAYADTIPSRPPAFTPTPWMGTPNTNFVGDNGVYDSGVVRLDNPTSTAMTGVKVTVTIGSTLYDLWGVNTIPANGSLVLTQVGQVFNFDTSEDPSGGTCAAPSHVIPVIHVTFNSVTTNHYDSAQVLTTGGVDFAECVINGNEGTPYTATT